MPPSFSTTAFTRSSIPRRNLSALVAAREQPPEKPLIFRSSTLNPYHNLALEHYLLTHTDPKSYVLFLYTNQPCVVIGRNQNPWVECNLPLLENGLLGRKGILNRVHLVRRRSGGGAVFHDEGNLNFSVLVPNDANFTRRKHAEMVVRAIKGVKLPARTNLNQLWEDVWVNERHDISMRRVKHIYKTSGSAFKLTRGRALHHGTLLHSSHHIDAISKFLRSPGKTHIRARGVESVRSPVSNLYDSNMTPLDRDNLTESLTQSIVQQFQDLYGTASTMISLDDHDCDDPAVPETAHGVEELQSPEWQFEQTPRFEVTSPHIDGHRLQVEVDRGVVEKAQYGDQRLDHWTGVKLHDQASWASLGRGLSSKVTDFMETVLPTVGSTT